MKAKRLLAIMLAVVLIIAALSACGNQGGDNATTQAAGGDGTSAETNAPSETDTQAPEQGGDEQKPDIAFEDTIVRVAIQVDPSIFGPYQTTNKGRKEVLPEIYECLAMQQGVGGEIKGVMAKDWHAAEGEDNTYIVELYDYIKDSNGNDITADDVIYSFTDAGANDFKRYLVKMDSIEKVDDYTLKIKMKDGKIDAFDMLLSRVYVIDEDSFKADPDAMTNDPVGTGPYDLTDYVAGSKVTLTAREDYWQTDESKLVQNQLQNVKTIEFNIIPEAAQQSIALETGVVDIVNGMSANGAKRFEGNSDFTIESVLGNNVKTIMFNCNEASPCSDVKVRQAICYAIDNESAMQGVLDGAGEAAFCFGNETSTDVPEEWNDGSYYPQDLDKAKELLKEAGYEDGLTLKLLTFVGEQETDIANIVYAFLDKIGIKVEILQYEEALVKTYQRDWTSFDMLILQRNASGTYVVTNWYEKLSKTTWDDGLNYCGFADDKLEQLLNTAYDVKTHNADSVKAVSDEINDKAYVYSMFAPFNYSVHNDTIEEVCLDLDYWLIPGCCKYVWN